MSKELHVHTCDKEEDDDSWFCKDQTCQRWELKETLQDFQIHSNMGPLGDSNPNSFMYFMVNSIILRNFKHFQNLKGNGI